VYGNPHHKSGSIEDDPHQAESYYGLTKSIGESIAHAETNQIPTSSIVILRLPNIFGENQNKGVVYNLLSNFKQNQLVTINGNGEQLRDFLHVRDLISLIGKIASESQENGVYNLSSPFSMSINNLVSLLRGESSSKVVFKDYDLEQSSLHLDYSKALAHFGEFYSYTMRYLKNDFNWGRDF
jgi:UDP-glucose 4-epimerase